MVRLPAGVNARFVRLHTMNISPPKFPLKLNFEARKGARGEPSVFEVYCNFIATSREPSAAGLRFGRFRAVALDQPLTNCTSNHRHWKLPGTVELKRGVMASLIVCSEMRI